MSIFDGLFRRKKKSKDAYREIPPEEAIELDGVDESWREPLKISQDKIPPYSGIGYIQSPYTDFYTKRWGIKPIEDLGKYRDIVRNDPWVQSSIAVQIHLGLQKGYEWEVDPDQKNGEKVLDDTNRLFSLIKNELDQHILPAIMSDMIVYGCAYIELVYGAEKKERKLSKESRKQNEYIDINGIKRRWEGKKEIDIEDGEILLNIKALDPYYMRVRNDSLGNVYGYLQVLSFPPIAFTCDKIVQFRWMPRTLSHESAYGTSDLMSMVRTAELIRACENNLYIGSHTIVRPPVIFKAMSGDTRPLSDPEWERVKGANESRRAGDDIYAMGTDVQPQAEPGVAMNAMIEFYKLLREDRIVAMGVPRNIMGIPEGSSHTTAAVNWDSFIVKLHGLQQRIGIYILHKIVYPGLIRMGWNREDLEESGLHMEWNDLAIQDENMDTNRAINEFKAFGITLNEFRKMIHLEDVDEEKGDKFLFELNPQDMDGGMGGMGDSEEVRDPMRTKRAGITSMGLSKIQQPELMKKVVETPAPAWDPYEDMFEKMMGNWDEKKASDIPDSEITKWVTIKGRKVPIGEDGEIHKDYNMKEEKQEDKKEIKDIINNFMSEMEEKYDELKLEIYITKDKLNLSRISLPKNQRGRGIGGKVMKKLIDLADKEKKIITLTPSSDYGGTVSRLKKFYKTFGFVENKGRNKDFGIKEDMYRESK